MSLAVALPGRSYPVTGPAVSVVTGTVAQHGYDVRTVDWGALAQVPEDPDRWVVERLVEAVGDDRCELVVAKSLGTRAASYAAQQGWPAIWVTPLLQDDGVVAGIRANPAPQLLVCGLADPLHDPEAAAGLAEGSREVLELPGVDHALSSTGDLVVQPDILGLVERTSADFVRRLG